MTPFDQASELRAAMLSNRIGDLAAAMQVAAPASPARSAYVIAVASGKGGVGKTHVSVNLALTLGRMGRRTTLIDLDLGTANVDVLLNLQPQATLVDYLAGRCTADRLARQFNPSVQVVAGPSGESRQAEYLLSDPVRLKQTIDELSHTAHAVLLDCGAGVGPLVRTVAGEASLLLVVTTPDPAAMADAYALIKVVHATLAVRRTPILLVVNQVTNERQSDWVAGRVSSVAKRFLGVDIVGGGFIRTDQHVQEAGRRRQALVEAFPRSRAATDVAALATRLQSFIPMPLVAGQCCA